ncbi:LysR family transcriptional regulator [Streptomyces sp. R1]|uniref:LysR substrate-binding domain-containing protein n=1 Tax=Streptomyces sp. R1 TaxID=1509279 RepID=UPI001E3A947C|nr:LysR substrate-binding domain-containing protein [Streptomyces sp. R1]MCC8340555.1 LysR family transcriptional regulator [Streptomyces sp. R1]
MGLDLHKLDHLIAVAEEHSITRAAARLHLSQQALSTSIRVLEREVGVPLLERTAAGVVLLPAGAALVEDARVLRGTARAALQRARRIGRGEKEVLRLGHTPAVTGEEIIVLLRQVGTVHPRLATDVNQRYPGELTEALLAGDLDIGLCRAMAPPYGLARTTLGEHPLNIAVAADHPLAGRTSVALSDLADQRFIVWGQPGHSGYTDLLIAHCHAAGFEPRTERTALQGTPPVTAVIGTDRVAFVTTAPGPAAGGAARILALTPPVYAPLHALYSPRTTSPARDAFLAAATL